MDGFVPDALAFDLDGTIYLAERPLPGARELVAHLRQGSIPHLFATNNSSVTAVRYVERLNAMGVAADRSHLLTSTDVAIDELTDAGVTRAYLVATAEVRAEFAASGIAHDEDDAEAVVLTFDTSLDYRKIREAAALLRAGAPYFATHPDLVCPTPDGPIPDCGSFIALFAAATGREPLVLGKPSAAMAGAIRRRLTQQATASGAAPPARIAFVGDRLYTDVRMANDHGFTAVLTLTGEATREDLATGPYRADLVVTDLHELLALIRGRADVEAARR